MADLDAGGGPPDNNPTPDRNTPGGTGDSPPQDPGADHSIGMIVAGCAFGVAFIALGLVGPAQFRYLPHEVFLFMISMGCGIILAVFGTRAGLRYRGLYVTGVGVGVGLVFVALNPDLLCRFNIIEKGCAATESVVSGRLVGDFDGDKIRSFAMDTASAPPILGAIEFEQGRISGYIFEIREKNLDDQFEQCVRVHIYEDGETVVKVPFDEVRRHFAGSGPVAWNYRAAETSIYTPGADGNWYPIGLPQCGNALPTDSADTTGLDRRGGDRKWAARVVDWLVPPAWADDIRAIIDSLDQSGNASKQTALRAGIVDVDEAVSVAAEWLAAQPDDPERKWQTLRILDESLPQTKDPVAALAALPEETKVILASLVDDEDEKLGSFAVGILSTHAGADWVWPAVEAFDRAQAPRDDFEAIVLQALFDRLPEGDRPAFREKYLAGHADTAFGKTLATLVAPADPTTAIGWSYFGRMNDDVWTERTFDIAGDKKAQAAPQKGDTLTPNTEVNVREGVIEFVKSIGWVNKPILEVAKPGERFSIVDTSEVHPGFFWVQLSRAEN
jgi:hypothetical protein